MTLTDDFPSPAVCVRVFQYPTGHVLCVCCFHRSRGYCAAVTISYSFCGHLRPYSVSYTVCIFRMYAVYSACAAVRFASVYYMCNSAVHSVNECMQLIRSVSWLLLLFRFDCFSVLYWIHYHISATKYYLFEPNAELFFSKRTFFHSFTPSVAVAFVLEHS